MPATHHYVNYDYNYVNYYYITLESQTHIGGKPVVPREKITLYLYVGLNQFKLEKPTYKQYNLQHTKQYNLVPDFQRGNYVKNCAYYNRIITACIIDEVGFKVCVLSVHVDYTHV